jgi:hypothetical protein
MQNLKTLQQPLLRELAMSRKKERGGGGEKKMPFTVATYVYASSQGQRMHSARTKMINNMSTKTQTEENLENIIGVAEEAPIISRNSEQKK